MIKASEQISLIAILSALCVLLSTTCMLINAKIFHYIGNNYCPDLGYPAILIVGLTYLGAYNLGGLESRLTQTVGLLFLFYLVHSILFFATNAVQLTPFDPIDKKIVEFEPFDILTIVKWTKEHHFIRSILGRIYNFISIEMLVIPGLLILTLKRQALYEYLILILMTTLLGFIWYYFFPTTAPASVFSSNHFPFYQQATGIKFYEIHHHIAPSTIEGGVRSLPSFHTIWAWLTLYAIRSFRKLFWILLPLNLMIIVSCVMLGWHYFLDIIASFLVLFCAHGLCIMYGATAKWRKTRGENHPCIQ